MTTLYLIRHAEAEGNLYRRAQGHFNSTITDRGYLQLGALRLISDGEVLGEYPIAAGAGVERISVFHLWGRLLRSFFGSPFKKT